MSSHKQDRHGKVQHGIWLTPEEKTDLASSIEALGRRSFADLVRRLIPAIRWSKSRREAFAQLTDPKRDDQEHWVLVRLDKTTYWNLQAHAEKGGLPAETCAAHMIEAAAGPPKTNDEILDMVEAIRKGAAAHTREKAAAKQRTKAASAALRPLDIDDEMDQISRELESERRAGATARGAETSDQSTAGDRVDMAKMTFHTLYATADILKDTPGGKEAVSQAMVGWEKREGPGGKVYYGNPRREGVHAVLMLLRGLKGEADDYLLEKYNTDLDLLRSMWAQTLVYSKEEGLLE